MEEIGKRYENKVRDACHKPFAFSSTFCGRRIEERNEMKSQFCSTIARVCCFNDGYLKCDDNIIWNRRNYVRAMDQTERVCVCVPDTEH